MGISLMGLQFPRGLFVNDGEMPEGETRANECEWITRIHFDADRPERRT